MDGRGCNVPVWFVVLLLVVLSVNMFVTCREAAAFTRTMTINQTVDGQNMTFNFSSLPAASSSVTVSIRLFGDYNASEEYAQVWFDGVAAANHDGGSQCVADGVEKIYSVSSATVSDGTLVVRVDLSDSVGMPCGSDPVERVVVTLSYETLPDLQVNFSAAPYTGSTAGAGSQFTVRYSLANYGADLTTNFYTYFYYCPSASTSGCTYLGRQYITTDMTGGGTYYFTSPTLVMPSVALYGTRYIDIRADGISQVFEANEANNDRFDAVAVTSRPDLTVANQAVPLTGSIIGSGSSFTVQAQVTNAAEATQVPLSTQLDYAYCRTTSETYCTSLATSTIPSGINAGGSYTATSPTMTLPATVVRGTGYFRSRADADNIVAEANENNNYAYTAIAITAYPDLQVSQLSLAPIIQFSGGQVQVTSQITNSGAASTGGDFGMRIYYSEDASITTGDTLLTTHSHTEFPAGSTSTVVSTVTLPTTASPGTRYIGAMVDYGNSVDEGAGESNNTRATAITVVAGNPDLAMESWSVSGPVTGYGDSTSLTFTVANEGTAASGPVSVKFYYSDSSDAGDPSVALLHTLVLSELAAANTATYSVSVPLPASVLAGTRYIHYLIDADNEVEESDETNNRGYRTLTVAGNPDIVVQSLALAPSSQIQGRALNITYILKNNGTTRLPEGSRAAVYYSANNTITVDDTLLASQPIAAITAGGASAEVAISVTIPIDAEVGTRYLGLFADDTNQIAEANEVNNTKASGFTCLQGYLLNVVRSGNGNGMVTGGDGVIDCGADCSSTFGATTAVALAATADQFSYFSGWSGDCTGTGVCNLDMSAQHNAVADFGVRGDYDGNGEVNLADLIRVLSILAGDGYVAEVEADTDDNGRVEMADGLYIIERLAAGP